MYVGVDGGGTKTAVVALDKNLNKKFEKTYGSLHYNQVGETGIKDIVSDIYDNLGSEIDVFFGVPMYGENNEVDNIIRGIIYQYFPNAIIKNDVFAGHFGSLACNNGVNIVSGTGSIAVMIEDESFDVKGGFGHILGDEGSAYWIGQKTLQTYSKQLDGRLAKSVLFDLISKEEFDGLNYGFGESRSLIASYSKKCDKAATMGCSYCKQILDEACEELLVLFKAFNYNGQVSYSGSVFNSNYLKEKFVKLTNAKEPILSPVFGCVLYLYKQHNKLDDSIVMKLRDLQ